MDHISDTDIQTLARKLISDPSMREQMRAILKNPEALPRNRLWTWTKAKKATVPNPFLEGLAMGLAYAKNPDVATQNTSVADVIKRSLDDERWNSIPDALLQSRYSDLLQTRLWARKVVHLCYVDEQALCTNVKYWDAISPLIAEKYLPYIGISEGARPVDNETIATIHLAKGAECSSCVKPLESKSDRQKFEIRFLAKIASQQSVGFRYSLRDVFQPHAAKIDDNERLYEFASGQNTIPCLESFIIVVLPEDYVARRANAAQAITFSPSSAMSPLNFFESIVLGSLLKRDEEAAEEDFRQLDLWQSSGELLEDCALGNERRCLPPDLKPHVADIWPSFPEPPAGKRMLIARFNLPNPLQYRLLFWQLPKRKV